MAKISTYVQTDSLLDAERDLKVQGISRSLLLRLLWCGFLVTDLMQLINAESLIQLSKEDSHLGEIENPMTRISLRKGLHLPEFLTKSIKSTNMSLLRQRFFFC